MADIIRQTEEMVMPILDELGMELYDTEFIKEGDTRVLRVYIDKEGGISSDDTAIVCKRLSDLIDGQRSFINDPYTLEVSSPGITRALKKPDHFEKNIGRDVELKTYAPITYEEKGKKYSAKEFVCVLKNYDKDNDTVTVGWDDLELDIERSKISSAHLWVDF